MRIALRPLGKTFALASLCALVLLVLPAGGGAAGSSRCTAFDTQADAQGYFISRGGSPRHGIARLDVDGDGVACEQLGRSYVGFATIAYNAPRDFFYGSIAMPRIPGGNGRYACLAGNPRFPKGPRLIRVMRVRPGPDRLVFRAIRAEVHPATGHLVWKADVELRVPGRYYARIAKKVRLHPFGPNQCPAFSTRSVALP